MWDDLTADQSTLIDADKTEHRGHDYDFAGLHNIAKHIIHLRESSQALASTTSHLQEFHRKLLNDPPQGQDATAATKLADQMLSQKAVQVDVWKLRMESLEKRIQNVINLVC